MSSVSPVISACNGNSQTRILTHPDQLKSKRMHFSELGLSIYPESISKTTVVPNFESKFFGKIISNGTIVWRSPWPISAKDVAVLAEHLIKFDQSIHINTGTHGNKDGLNSFEAKEKSLSEGKFLQEDIEGLCYTHTNISFQVVSSLTSHIYPEHADHVIDAWCNGAKNIVLGPGINSGGYAMCTAAGAANINAFSTLGLVAQQFFSEKVKDEDAIFIDLEDKKDGWWCNIL